MHHASKSIHIIAQPRASFRERYCSETKTSGLLIHRRIRAETNPLGLVYPAIQIPSEWLGTSSPLYIRVTSVTVPTEFDSIVCIHPYPIDTEDTNVIRDPDNNTLYFPVTREDVTLGVKSFLLTRKKILQSELKHYGSLAILDANRRHTARITSKSRGKEMIRVYNLWKSQLAFCLAEAVNETKLKSYGLSIVFSQVISDSSHERLDSSQTASEICIDRPVERGIICAPGEGDWNGGDNLLMVLPERNRNAELQVYFDFIELNEKVHVQYEAVDMNTILIQTPSCPLQPGSQNRAIPICVTQKDKVIGKFDFVYLTPTRQVIMQTEEKVRLWSRLNAEASPVPVKCSDSSLDDPVVKIEE